MKIWLCALDAEVIENSNSQRLNRTDLMAYYFTQAGHEVSIWRSNFEHQSKSYKLPNHSRNVPDIGEFIADDK